MPCSTPTSATVSSVTSASASSTRSKRAIATQLAGRGRSASRRRAAPPRARRPARSGAPRRRGSAPPPRPRPAAGELGAPARVCDRGRSRRAGVDREGADQPGDDVAGADRQQIAADVRHSVAAPWLGRPASVAADWVTMTSATIAGHAAPPARSRAATARADPRLRRAVSDVAEDRRRRGAARPSDRDEQRSSRRARPALPGADGRSAGRRATSREHAQPDRDRPGQLASPSSSATCWSRARVSSRRRPAMPSRSGKLVDDDHDADARPGSRR